MENISNKASVQETPSASLVLTRLHNDRLNNIRRSSLARRNSYTTAYGKLTVHKEDNAIIYGFEDLHIWLPKAQKTIHLHPNDPDKFLVTEESGCYETAKFEFWARWKIYTQRRFKTSVRIETVN